MSETFRLTLAQLSPSVGDIDGNAAKARAAWDAAKAAGADLLVLQPRHEEAVRQTTHCLGRARSLLDATSTGPIEQVELVAHELRGALDALAGLGGRQSPDDVIGRVFATFCIGK